MAHWIVHEDTAVEATRPAESSTLGYRDPLPHDDFVVLVWSTLTVPPTTPNSRAEQGAAVKWLLMLTQSMASMHLNSAAMGCLCCLYACWLVLRPAGTRCLLNKHVLHPP